MPQYRIRPTEQNCSRCRVTKPVADFPMRPDRAEPLKQCLACAAEVEAQRLEDVKNHAEGMRVCTICNVKKPFDAFPLRGASRAGQRHFKCGQCVAEYSARRYLATREREEGRALKGAEELIAKGAVTRPCGNCKRELPLLQFVRDHRSNDGFKRTCRECDRADAKKRASSIDAEGERLRHRDNNLKRYAITSEIFNAISEAQGHCCRVCGTHRDAVKDKYGFHVDHSHTTGHIRGLLCRNCNIALGVAQDDPNILMALLLYLDLPPGPPPHSSLETWRAYLAKNEKAPLVASFPKTPAA